MPSSKIGELLTQLQNSTAWFTLPMFCFFAIVYSNISRCVEEMRKLYMTVGYEGDGGLREMECK
jgi:hypothetical protein